MSTQSTTKPLTDRDAELLEVLLVRLRILSVAQVARTWWSETRDPVRNARKRLRELAQRELVAHLSICAHPEQLLTVPVLRWSPGRPVPDFGGLAYELERRWQETYRSTPAVFATGLAASRHGGVGGRPPRPAEETHDLHLASVYLHFRAHHPHRARTWKHEDLVRARRREMRPDATVQEGSGRVAIELAGKYSPEKLEAFHDHCAKRRMPYELW